MVTGVETAGLVLGSLPIIIEALKSYHDGVKTMKKLRGPFHHLEIGKLLREARSQQIHFADNVKNLLLAACPTYQKLDEDYDEDLSDLRSSKTQAAVQNYLGPIRYKQFMELLADFENCLIDLATELDQVQCFEKQRVINTPLDLPTIRTLIVKPPNRQYSFWARTKYVFAEGKIKTFTEDLASFTNTIERLLTNRKTQHEQVQKEQLMFGSIPAIAVSATLLLQQIRVYTDRLFRAFLESWAAGCHPSHEAMLFLDTPVFTDIKSLSTRISSYKFRLMLRGDLVNMSAWHEADVTVFNEQTICNEPQNRVASTSVQPSSSQSIPTISLSHATPLMSILSQSIVDNLCQNVAHAKKVQKCADLHLRQGRCFLSAEMSYWPVCQRTHDWAVISLEQVLTSKIKISPNQKNSIALKLAASLLQLESSQWLTAKWSNKSIYFPETPKIDFAQPLIRHSFCRSAAKSTSPVLPRIMFLELGILLMEIWNRELFATFAKRHGKIEEIHAFMRQGLANEWYEETYDLMTPQYGRVVRTCVNFAGEYTQGSQSWDDEQLRVSVCTKIISPLKDECFPKQVTV